MKRKNMLSEVFRFLWQRKAYWIFPVIFFLVMLVVVIILGTSPAVDFIYPLL